MNRQFRIIQLLLMLVCTIVLFIFVAFAWYISLDKTDPIIINTGSLRADCKFYRGIDSNYDGELDDDSFIEITEADLHFVNVIPGQIYTFKLSVTNIGTISGFLSVRMNNIITEDEDLLNYFNVSFVEPTETEIIFSAAEDGKLELFNKYILEPETTFDFIFQIKVGNFSGDNFHLKSLTIEHFIVDLIQIHSD